jgi:outer membrane protein TolC
LPADSQQPANGLLGPIENNRNTATTFNTFQVQAGMTSYELDFFGHQRAIAHESGKLAQASEADYESARIALIGEVANAYLVLNADRALLQLANETEDAQHHHAQVMQKAYSDGGVSEFDMRRSQTQVDAAQVDVQDMQIRIAKDMDALAVLIGQPVLPDYARRIAFLAAGPSSGHHRRRRPVTRRQRRYRTRPRRLLPQYRPDGRAGHLERRPVQPVPRQYGGLEYRGLRHRAAAGLGQE